MTPSLVSIILPTYNGSRYLGDAVESIRGQTHTNWELIIIDDCSTDTTPDILRDYCGKDSRIRGLRHERNKGLPEALNTGFREARGEFQTWTSDDNLFEPNALSLMLAAFEASPAVDAVYADYVTVDDAGRLLRQVILPDNIRDTLAIPILPCFLWRRALRERVGGFNPAYALAEDRDYWLRVNEFGTSLRLAKPLYRYREHAASLTGAKWRNCIRASHKLTFAWLPRCHWLTPEEKALIYARAVHSLVDIGLKQECPEDFRTAWACVSRAFWLHMPALRAVRFSDLTKLVLRVRGTRLIAYLASFIRQKRRLPQAYTRSD